MSEWKEYKLEELAEITSSKRIFYSEYVSKGIPFYRSKEIIDKHNRREIKTELFISEDRFNEIKEKFGVPEKDDILLTSVGSLGIPYLVKENDVFYFKDGNLTWFRRIDKRRIDVTFFMTWLNSNVGKQKLDEVTIGSTQSALTISGLKTIEIALPPIPEQCAIAKLLNSLDDKIDLLHRQNATIESLAETLFRLCFLEEAKEYWNTKKVKEVCSMITKGTTPTTLGKQFKDSGINFIKAESLTEVGGFIHEKFAFIDFETDEMLKRSRIQKGDILITIAGTIGRIAYTTEDILPANTNQAIGIMRVNKDIVNPYFIYCLFKTPEIRDDFDGRVVHAVQPNLSLGEIGNIEFKMPPKENLDSGMERIIPLFKKKEKNQNQIRTLTALRDTLLPKLMSGKVRVEM